MKGTNEKGIGIVGLSVVLILIALLILAGRNHSIYVSGKQRR